MKKIITCLLAVCMLLPLSAKSKKSKSKAKPAELTVLAAASLTDVLGEVNALYAEKNGTKITASYASSGILQKQIEQGAPADVFISAGKKQMNALVSQGLVSPQDSFDLLENKIVLIANSDSNLTVTDFKDVLSPQVKMIALGDFAHVPVGQYSQKLFTNLGILEEVKAKANFGSDVRTVLTWIELNEADVGVVYATDAMISKKVKILAEAPEGSTDKVIYPAGIISSTSCRKEAVRYIEFLKSAEVQQIFAKYGFSGV